MFDARSHRLIQAVVCHASGVETPTARHEVFDADDADAAMRAGLACLTLAAAGDGALTLSNDANDKLQWAAESERGAVQRSLASARRATESLSRASIPSRMLKGIALTGTAYDLGTRSFVDADVLVPADQLAPALDALQLAGFRRVGPARHRLETEFAKAIMLVHPEGAPVDLHRLPIRAPIGARIAADFFEHTEQSSGWLVPDAAGRGVHAALTLLVGDRQPRPVQYIDVRRTLDQAGLDAMLGRASDLGVLPLVAAAVDVAHEALGLGPLDLDYRPSRRDVRLVRAARSSRRLGFDVAWLVEMSGVGPRARYLRYLLGSREYADGTKSRLQKARELVGSKPTPEAPGIAVDVCITNARHHRRLIEGAVRELAGAGSRVRVLSFSELRGERTPTSFDVRASVCQVLPPMIARLRTGAVPLGVPEASQGASIARRALGHVIKLKLRTEWRHRQPDLVLLLNDTAFPSSEVVQLADAREIPTLLMQEGIRFDTGESSDSGSRYGSRASRGVLAWGERSADHFRSVRSDDRVTVVGHPYLRPAALQTQIPTGRRLLVCSNPLTAFGLASDDEQFDALERFLRAASEAAVDIMLRPHPQEDGARFTALADRHGARIDSDPLVESLERTDAVAVFASTVGIDALVAGRTLGVLELPRGGFAFDYVDAGIGIPLSEPDFHAIDDLFALRDSDWDDRRLAYLREHLGPDETPRRIADACIEIATSELSR